MTSLFIFLAMAANEQIERLMTPQHAAAFAVADLATIADQEDRRFQRYLWIPPWGSAEWIPSTIFTVNAAVSTSEVIQKPRLLANGWLMRFDLRSLAPEDDDLQRIIDVWDGLATQDPYFHVPSFNSGVDEAVAAPHLSAELVAQLAELNESSSLVYRADWFIVKSLSTTNGGVYYDFMGFRDLPVREDGNGGSEAAILAKFGLFEDFSKRSRGDRRVGMLQSQVTGKSRAVAILNGFVGRGYVTEDIFDQDVSADRHALYNLIENEFRGRELIIEMPNGLHAFAITADNGDLLNAAPPNLVTDHRVPAPYTNELQGAISCIRCHGPEGGLKPCANDVATLLSGPLRIVDDLDEESNRKSIDRIAGMYGGGRFDRLLRRGNEDYAAAIDEITAGDMEPADLFQRVSYIYAGHQYQPIDARQALLEIGYKVDEEEFSAIDAFRALVSLEEGGLGPVIAFEDPVVAALYSGLKVTRTDWDRVFVDVMLRAEQTKDPQ